MNRKQKFILKILDSVKGLSKDPTTKVGAVAFEDLDSLRILATGYNGFASKCLDTYVNISREEKLALTVHAEVNLVANASRNGVSLKNSTVVISEPPCPQCFSVLVNAGVSKILSPKFENCPHYERWSSLFDLTKKLIHSCPTIRWEELRYEKMP